MESAVSIVVNYTLLVFGRDSNYAKTKILRKLKFLPTEYV